MEKKVIRIGSVGLGGIWTGVHEPGTRRSPDLELVAICDIDEEKLKAAGEKYGIDEAHRFVDYHDLINCPDVDAVDICTSNDAHFEIGMAAVEAGKPYDIEKPITMTAEEADILANATKEKGIKNMVCFSYRFKAAARYAKDLIAQGKIGKVYHVDMQYFQAWGLPRVDCPLAWRFIKNRTGSGALGDLGCHALDLVRFVLGKEYTNIVGHTGTYVKERKLEKGEGVGQVDVDDFCNYMADMEDGISASFQITRFGFGRGNYQRMEIYGSEGAIVYSLDATPGLEDEIEVCSGDINADAHVFSKLPIPQQYYSDQMQSFADILNGVGDGMPATIFDGQANQHVVDTILESAEAGKWMEIK
ncbi:Gfo/Idh/MocA family protein [Neglectibacter timonensis]|uniref:Gfo/Idh/MocA family protein n=1 Tax=Neglectibacter timonensis TaxID=1776382 RepID=UPI00266C4C36|nr:Gfo/Idh/MocA family oxidoreductase [Neglectibacter timonensis]